MPSCVQARWNHTLTALIASGLATLICLQGCSDSKKSDSSEAQRPLVDPRFASAEATLDHYNSVVTSGPKVDVSAIISMFYAETPLQQRLLRLYNASIPIMDLDEACWETFGVGYLSTSKEPPRTPARERAVMTEGGADRAKARHRENDGRTVDLYFVRIGDRWWLSGYTLEYDPEFDMKGVDPDRFEQGIAHFASAAQRVTAEIRAGKWKDAGKSGQKLARQQMGVYLEHEAGSIPDMDR